MNIAAPKSAQKLRGGYYTPSALASWLTNWAIQRPTDTVLEPSCGDGVFVSIAAQRLASVGASKLKISRQIIPVEILGSEAQKAKAQLESHGINLDMQVGDFFAWSEKNRDAKFACAIGNPPFIRYQNFPEPSRSRAMSIMERSGLTPNRLTNIWVPFVVAAVNHLETGGRLAMVLPAELLQVSYAAQLRSFLVDRFSAIEIVSCNDLVFERAEQEVVLILASGRLESASKQNRCSINLISASSLAEVLRRTPMKARQDAKFVNHDNEKWLKYFLSPKEITLMRNLRQSTDIANLSAHASVDVGVVTGRNEFFVVSQDEVAQFGLRKYVVPLVGRSAQLRGAIIERRELGRLAKEGGRVYLLAVNPKAKGTLTEGIRRYIRLGESRGMHTGYKCAIRNPWYSVPATWDPHCFFFRQIYDFPRIVLNRAAATSTDTIHRLRCIGTGRDQLASNLYTYLTAASAEIEGRSYGGGVLELEPTEAERLLVPKKLNGSLAISELDSCIRAGQLNNALEENSRMVLVRHLGLSNSDCTMLRNIWQKMRDRRMSRKKA